MPAEKTHCKRLLERFRDFPLYPKEAAVLLDRAGQLADVCRSNDHADSVCELLLRTSEFFPLPKHFEEAVETLRRGNEPVWESAAPRCRDCLDMGWKNTAAGVVRCDCKAAASPPAPVPRARSSGPRAERDLPAHPEIALGIPPILVTAKTLAVKRREAEHRGYTGPLTLADAVERGMLLLVEAQRRVEQWEAASGSTLDRVREGLSELAKRHSAAKPPVREPRPELVPKAKAGVA